MTAPRTRVTAANPSETKSSLRYADVEDDAPLGRIPTSTKDITICKEATRDFEKFT